MSSKYNYKYLHWGKHPDSNNVHVLTVTCHGNEFHVGDLICNFCPEKKQDVWEFHLQSATPPWVNKYIYDTKDVKGSMSFEQAAKATECILQDIIPIHLHNLEYQKSMLTLVQHDLSNNGPQKKEK